MKIRLRGPDGEVEIPWAERVGEHNRLDDLPWHTYRISDDAIIEASATEFDGVYEFVRVVQPSGNRLIRVIFDDRQYQSMLDQSQAMGPIREAPIGSTSE